jgi:hypothetical protein
MIQNLPPEALGTNLVIWTIGSCLKPLFCRCTSDATSGVHREFLRQLFAGGNLPRLQKGFDEFAFSANGQAGKSLEPWTVRHFGFGAEPIRHQPKLIGGDVAAADAVKQMIEEMWRKVVAPNLRHG